MIDRSGIRKVVASAVVAAAVTFTPLTGGIVSAEETEDINLGVGELQECAISKSMDADVDGRDFLAWQRGTRSSDQGVSGSDLADWQANYGGGY
jgi:hypothetical protein